MTKLSEEIYSDMDYANMFEDNHGGNLGASSGGPLDTAFTASLHDRFYKCLSEGTMYGRYTCVFKGSWDYFGVYSLITGNEHYKKLVSFFYLSGLFNVVIG